MEIKTLINEVSYLNNTHDTIDKMHTAILELGLQKNNLFLQSLFRTLDRDFQDLLENLESLCRIKKISLEELKANGIIEDKKDESSIKKRA